MPSAQAIEKVRRFNADNLRLNAYARRPEVAAGRRLAYGVEPPARQRSATEAEIMEIAARLDAGELLNPRLWRERFEVRDARRAA